VTGSSDIEGEPMKLNQLSVFLENQPGALSAPCRLLAEAGINIQTFALADTQQFGILRLILPDWKKAKELLEKSGFVVRVTEVVALQVPDRPGGLLALLEIIEQARVNVEYVYAFTAKQENQGLMLFRFDNPDAAIRALQANRISVVSTVDLFKSMES
jgi:hypothetical protein